MTSLVHDDVAARNAAQAAAVLFGGDPRDVAAEALALVAVEVASSSRRLDSLQDVPAVLVDTGLAASKSEARRLLQQGSVRANGEVIGAASPLTSTPLLHDRYLLLRKGRRSHHLLEIFRDRG